jgi:hypothetical protein
MSKKRTMHPYWLALPLLPALCVYFISQFPEFIETYYAQKMYPALSQYLRFASGWLPVSLGDIFYFLIGLFLIIQIFFFVKNLRNKNLTGKEKLQPLIRMSVILAICYTVFYVFWGLNYYRKGITDQLELKMDGAYPTQELLALNSELLQIINQLRIHPDFNKHIFPSREAMFKEAASSYQNISDQFYFLEYRPLSLKPSLYGRLGNYGGFMGYYNPFTGEGQVNTTCPPFLQPFITCHEIAHQIGYASESEANFIGFLATMHSNNIYMQYSGQLEMYLYASGKLRQTDSNLVKSLNQQLHPLVKKDLKEYKDYLQAHETIVQDWTNAVFDLFLKSNQQQQGIYSYKDVVGWAIAYRKKFGSWLKKKTDNR